MQELRVNLRTAHGQAIGVRCSLLVLRILVANEPHTLQQDDDDKMPMPARTLYFTPSGDAHELLADGLFAALVLDLPASLRGSNWINASEPYLRPVQKAVFSAQAHRVSQGSLPSHRDDQASASA